MKEGDCMCKKEEFFEKSIHEFGSIDELIEFAKLKTKYLAKETESASDDSDEDKILELEL